LAILEGDQPRVRDGDAVRARPDNCSDRGDYRAG
jgi:hypothetical protein